MRSRQRKTRGLAICLAAIVEIGPSPSMAATTSLSSTRADHLGSSLVSPPTAFLCYSLKMQQLPEMGHTDLPDDRILLHQSRISCILSNVSHNVQFRNLRQNIQMNVCIQLLEPIERRRPTQRECRHEPVHRGVIERPQLF